MNEKLQELTKKIYDEGLEKGQQEGRLLVEKARKEAEEQLKKAEELAQKLVEDAKKDAEELHKKVNSELQMASKQAMAQLKQQITSLINEKAVNQVLEPVIKDDEMVKNLIMKIAESWIEIHKESQGAAISLAPKDQQALEAVLMKNVASVISNGLEINFEEGIHSGFKIGPKDGSFKISFTDKDFEQFFLQFLRPRTRKFFNE